MTTTNDGLMTMTAGTDLEVYRRVIHSAGTWIYAGVGVPHDAVTDNRYASGNLAAGARHWSMPGTYKLWMATAFNVGDIVYGAASGKGSTTKSGDAIGVCINSSAAVDAYAEVMPLLPMSNYGFWTKSYTAVAGDGVAGYIDFTPPFPAYPGGIIPYVTSAAGAPRVITTVTNPATNVIRLTVAGLTNGDLVSLIAFNSPEV